MCNKYLQTVWNLYDIKYHNVQYIYALIYAEDNQSVLRQQ